MKNKTLKEFAAGVTVNFVRVGFNPQTEQTKFICLINDQSFDFTCGLMACIPVTVPRQQRAWQIAAKEKPVMVAPMAILASRYKMRNDNSWRVLQLIQSGQIKAANNLNHPHVLAVFKDISSFCQPTAYDLLYCLRLDVDGVESESFENWCGNFGYDTDSIKALKTFEACKDEAAKLRKALGDKYAEFLRVEVDD